jgi:heme/copper-type cytochrome/quinol oxidase subunit 2
MKRLISALPFLLIVANALAQRTSPSVSNSPSAEDAAAAAAAATGMAGMGFACCFVYIIMIVVSVGGWIFAAIWVMNDAKARNSENAQLVTVLTWIPPTWVIGLIVHLVTRPKGNLVPCPHCGKKRLEGLATCPHCGQP